MNRTIKNIVKGLIILLVIVGISYLILSIPGGGVQKNVSGVLVVMSTLSSFITLLVALVLFNKFGIESNILEKNLDALSKIFDALNNIAFRIEYDGNIRFFHSALRDLREGNFISHGLLCADRIVLFDVGAWKGLKNLSSVGESIYTPKLVADNIRKLYIGSITPPADLLSNSKKYATVRFAGVKGTVFSIDLDKEIESTIPGLPNGKEISLKDYLELYDNLYQSCKQWLNLNSSINLDLNS